MSRHADDEELKHARGTFRNDRVQNRVTFDPLKPKRKTPKGLLTKRAKSEWRRVTQVLIKAGISCEAGRSILVMYCNEVALHEQLTQEIAEARSMKAPFNPLDEKRADLALKNATKIGDMFGFSPTSISRIKPSESKKNSTTQTAADKLDALIFDN